MNVCFDSPQWQHTALSAPAPPQHVHRVDEALNLSLSSHLDLLSVPPADDVAHRSFSHRPRNQSRLFLQGMETMRNGEGLRRLREQREKRRQSSQSTDSSTMEPSALADALSKHSNHDSRVALGRNAPKRIKSGLARSA